MGLRRGDWERGREGEREAEFGVLERVRPRDSERAAEGERDDMVEVVCRFGVELIFVEVGGMVECSRRK